jgi:hypothetical protein
VRRMEVNHSHSRDLGLAGAVALDMVLVTVSDHPAVGS